MFAGGQTVAACRFGGAFRQRHFRQLDFVLVLPLLLATVALEAGILHNVCRKTNYKTTKL